MQTMLGDMKKSKQYGKVKTSGKKSELVNEFRRVRGEAAVQQNVTFAATTTATGKAEAEAESSATPTQNQEKIQAAQLAMSQLMIPADIAISDGTHQALTRLGMTKRFAFKDQSADISKDLEQVTGFTVHLDEILATITVESDYSDNFESLREALRQKHNTIVVANPLFNRFFSALGIQVEEDWEMQMAIQASTAGRDEEAYTKAVEEELNVLRSAVEFRIQRWTETFPEPDAQHAEWPLDFTEVERKMLKDWITLFLDGDDDKAEERWSREMKDDELDALVKELQEKDDFPVDNDKGRTESVLRAVIREVKGHRDRSRSRSRSQSVAASGALSDEEEEADSSAKGKGKKRARGAEDAGSSSKRGRGTLRGRGGGRQGMTYTLIDSDDEE